MLTLLLGRDWTANRNEILHRIARDVRNEKPGRILLVPELISHESERLLATVAGDTSSRFAQVLSFTRLARRICDLVGSAAEECLDNGGRVVAMASAARQLSSRLKAYASVETKPEFLTQLVDAVDEFKRCCTSAEDLQAAAAQTGGSLAQKLEELSLIMLGYDSLCQRGRRDPRDQMTWVLEQLEEIDFGENHVFYVDGFPDFTRQHLAVLEHLIRVSPNVTVSLNCDHVESRELAFEKAANTARQLMRCAERVGVEVHIETLSSTDDPLKVACGRLFQGAVLKAQCLEGRLEVFKAESLYQECQAVAERILDLVAKGCRYRDIALVCGDMESYRRVLHLVFRKCGIPLYLSGTEDILRSGVISTVLLALDAALGGLEQRDVLRYLRSVLSPLSQELCDKVENHAVIWGISGKGWTSEWTQHPDGLGAKWYDTTDQRLKQLNDAREMAILPLVHLREHFAEAKNLRQQVLALYEFLEETQFAHRLGIYADALESEGDGRGAQILNQLWEILLSAMEQLHDVLGDTAWDDETFARLLKLLLSQYDVGTIPPVLDAVMAGPVSAMRCQREKYLFVLGAEEGNLPGYGGSAGVLSDQERTELRNLGVPLTGGAVEGLQAEFAEIYGVFCGAEKQITVSCSGSQPSFVYRRLAEMAGGIQQVKPLLGGAMVDGDSAAAFLAKWKAADAADQLGILDAYLGTIHRVGYSLGKVEPGNVRKLYGDKLRLSASQVDQHGECRLAYFLKYGLRARERKEATVDPAEFGTYVHAVLENTGREVMGLGGFHQVTLEQTMEIARRYSAEYAAERFSQLSSQRMEYLFRRNMAELEMVVQELWRELYAAEYAPHAFELHFSEDGQMPAIEIRGQSISAELIGFVDRVDQWKRGDSTYFRVVDYKTGKKDFDYCDVYNGVGLQMLLYLFALEDLGQQVLPGKRISAGVQYFPARAPYLPTEGNISAEKAETERRKSWKRSGLLLNDDASLTAMDPSEKMDTLCCSRKKDGSLSGDVADRQQLGILKDYVMKLLGAMADEIVSGEVSPNPYTRGFSHNACSYCPYGNVCHPDTVPGRRNYKTVSAQQFWQDISKEVDDNG